MKRWMFFCGVSLALLQVVTARGFVCAHEYTPALQGPLGLNSVPSARMSESGTISIGSSTLDPYLHGYIGFQLDKSLYVGLRQSAEISNLNDDADRLYPGVDLKLRLLDETRLRPAIALGLQSAVGHKRMAGEYLALSKRYKSFDFTAGIGWGRHGTAAHFDNPLKFISHFKKDRLLDGEAPNGPSNWFTGESAGLFAGLEYFTPWDGLSVKFDWGADRYTAEQAAFDYQTPAPWGLGLSYSTTDWANASIGMQGTDKFMARFHIQTNPQNWPWRSYTEKEPKPFREYRTGLSLPGRMEDSANNEGLKLHSLKNDNIHTVRGFLELDRDKPTPHQIGRTIRHMANHGGPASEHFIITPKIMGLQGPQINLIRSDFENALGRDKQGSAEEIWINAELDDSKVESEKADPRAYRRRDDGFQTDIILDKQFSLSEEDSGTLYRSALILDLKRPEFFGFLTTGAALRLNLLDNLERLTDIRPRSFLPVRSDVDIFARRGLAVDRSYLSWMYTIRPGLHAQITGGYLEEMYGGFGGEILYRPFDSRFAIGAESWIALKRDPLTDLNLGFTGDSLLSSHVNLWYDFPKYDVTLGAKIGRYLAEDFGATLSLSRNFKSGTTLEGFVTLSDSADFDLFGSTTHAYHGVRLSVPLGGLHPALKNVRSETRFAPFGRDIGQFVEAPLPLYELTEPFSLRHLEKHWGEIVE